MAKTGHYTYRGLDVPQAYARVHHQEIHNNLDGTKAGVVGVQVFSTEQARRDGAQPLETLTFSVTNSEAERTFDDTLAKDGTIGGAYAVLDNVEAFKDWADA